MALNGQKQLNKSNTKALKEGPCCVPYLLVKIEKLMKSVPVVQTTDYL